MLYNFQKWGAKVTQHYLALRAKPVFSDKVCTAPKTNQSKKNIAFPGIETRETCLPWVDITKEAVMDSKPSSTRLCGSITKFPRWESHSSLRGGGSVMMPGQCCESGCFPMVWSGPAVAFLSPSTGARYRVHSGTHCTLLSHLDISFPLYISFPCLELGWKGQEGRDTTLVLLGSLQDSPRPPTPSPAITQ